MDVETAAYNTVHDYRGGCSSLGPLVGILDTTLQNKVNPTQELAKLTLKEAAKIVEVTGDRRIPDVFAALIGGLIVQAGYFHGISDQSLFEAYSKMMSELGDFSREFNEALQDRRITQTEIERLEQHMRDVQSAGAELINRAKQIAEPDSKDSSNE